MRKFIAALLILSFATQVLAWSRDGHAMVGMLAERQLQPAARAEVARLLAGEPDPSLAGVSSWADDLRETAWGSKSAPLHYVNFKGGDCTYLPARDCPDGKCVIAAIKRNFLILSDQTRPDAERRDALKYLVHFVGDVHQPLHSTPRGDRGGNDFQVSYQGTGSNLHKVWDGQFLQQQRLAAIDQANSLAALPQLPTDAAGISDQPELDWALESCRLVLEGNIYPTSHLIDDAYLARHAPLAEQRLRMAGSRLAGMINLALTH